MGRKPNPTKVVSIRLPLAAYEALTEKASKAGVPVSSYIKAQLVKAVGL